MPRLSAVGISGLQAGEDVKAPPQKIADLLAMPGVEDVELGVLLAERRDGAQGALLRVWLNAHVLPAFQGRVLPVDTTVALCSAGLHVPDPRPVRDALIAATALVHGMPVVTRNTADFDPTGVRTINPWHA